MLKLVAQSSTTVTTRTNFAFSRPSQGAGQTEVVWMEIDAGAVTPSNTETGWELVGTGASHASTRLAVYARRQLAGDAATTQAFNFGSSFSQGGILVFSGGIETGSVLSGTPVVNSSTINGTAETNTGMTTAHDRAMVIAFGGNEDVTGSHTSSFASLLQDASSGSLFGKIQPTAGATGSWTITSSASVSWVTVAFALAPGTPVAQPNEYLTQPDVAAGVAPASAASAWGAGAYVDLLPAGWDFDMALSAIEFEAPAAPAITTTYEALIEVATGASGAETVVAQIPWTFRNVTAVGYFRSDPANEAPLPEPIAIAAGTRVTVRVRDSHTAALTYTGVKAVFREVAAGGATYVDMDATIAGSAQASATLDRLVALDISIAGSSASSATLQRLVALDIAIAGSSVSSATLQRLAALTATSAGSAVASATLQRVQELSATSAGSATISADLTSGLPLVYVDMAATFAGSAQASATLDRLVELTASGAGSASATGTLQRLAALDAAIAGASAATGTLQRLAALTAALTGSSQVLADLTKVASMNATIAGSANVTAALLRMAALSTAIAGSASASADLQRIAVLAVSISGDALVQPSLSTGTAPSYLDLAAAISGAAQAQATLQRLVALDAAIVGGATTSATLQAIRAMQASAAGSANVTATLTSLALLNVMIAGSASFDGTLLLGSERDYYIESVPAFAGIARSAGGTVDADPGDAAVIVRVPSAHRG